MFKRSLPTVTIAAPHQLHLLFISTYIVCYTAPLKNTVTAVLEYIDLDCSIRVYRSFKQVFKRPLSGWGLGQNAPVAPLPVGGPGHELLDHCVKRVVL